MAYSIPFNPTEFVDESIHEVYKTLFEAGVLVLIVILVFLQDWRAVLIPATTVPVTIIGAFAAMAALGFTINMLTLFGLVLAIGIVVDDAIVIVENAVHHIDRGRMDPKEATIKAMSEVIGPVIGITLVLMAVFLPTAFLGGITGQLYRQFALTIAATALISAINAVTLKPAQCASLSASDARAAESRSFAAFNAVYDRCEAAYAAIVRRVVRHTCRDDGPCSLLWSPERAGGSPGLPNGFMPHEDQGYAIVGVQLPTPPRRFAPAPWWTSSSKILAKTPGIANWFMIGGNSILDQAAASNAAAFYVTFTPWSERTDKPGLSQEEHLEDADGERAADPRGDDLRVSAAGDPRTRRRGRLSDAAARTAAAWASSSSSRSPTRSFATATNRRA